MEERAREINRLQKMLEGANIKLTSALSDITGVAAQDMLQLVISGKPLTVSDISNCMRTLMRSTPEELYRSMDGIVTDLQRELLAEVLRVIKEQTAQVKRVDQLIEKHMASEYTKAAKAIDALPGIAQVSAQHIVAEIGIDMSRFPSAHHLCSWYLSGKQRKCREAEKRA